ncbi:M42 family metallopeptidase [Candidatus Mycoplasma pogonae]
MNNKNLDHLFNKLKTYCEIEGMSRHEDEVVEQLKANTKNAGVDYARDNFGSLIMTKKGQTTGPKILLAAHMDEVGYIVLRILDNGQLLIKAIGGVWPNVVVGTRAKLITTAGKLFYGVFGHTSIHILERDKITKAVEQKDLFADFGFKDKKEAEELGVEIGDKIYLNGETIRFHNGDFVGAKSMDNRAGVTVIDEIVNALKNVETPNQPYIVGTVQEEVGLRGAKTSTSIIKPDVAFAIDTGAAHDTHGALPGTSHLGGGVALCVADGGTLANPKLLQFLVDLGKKHNIPVYKFVSQGGGTDAEELQYGQGGVPTVSVSIPTRYLHSPIGVASLSDMQAVIDLMVEFIKTFDESALKQIKPQ